MNRLFSIFAALLLSATILFAANSPAAWGAQAAKADKDQTLDEMLRYAIEDEYLAQAEYAAILASLGSVRPFSNIILTERNHISWLIDAFATASLPLPADRAASFVTVPVGLRASLEAGVGAELDNIAMYDSFLSNPLLLQPSNASLRGLFTKLRDASKNHLAAFRKGLSP
jgi:rubrerythrin